MATRARSSPDEVRAARAERIEAAQEVLTDAVGAIRDSDGWRRYLQFQSELHEYSANYCLLLIVQHARLFDQGKVSTPVPSFTASYRKWKELGRQVERGQTGMAIIAPMRPASAERPSPRTVRPAAGAGPVPGGGRAGGQDRVPARVHGRESVQRRTDH